jgi:hypothetical protein
MLPFHGFDVCMIHRPRDGRLSKVPPQGLRWALRLLSSASSRPSSAQPPQRHECNNARAEQQPATVAQALSDELVEPPSPRLEPVKPPEPATVRGGYPPHSRPNQGVPVLSRKRAAGSLKTHDFVSENGCLSAQRMPIGPSSRGVATLIRQRLGPAGSDFHVTHR